MLFIACFQHMALQYSHHFAEAEVIFCISESSFNDSFQVKKRSHSMLCSSHICLLVIDHGNRVLLYCRLDEESYFSCFIIQWISKFQSIASECNVLLL